MVQINKINDLFELFKKINTLTKRKKPLDEYQEKWGDSLTEDQRKSLLKKIDNTKELIQILTTELEKELNRLNLPDEIIAQFLKALTALTKHPKSLDFKKQLSDLKMAIKDTIQKEEQLNQQKNNTQKDVASLSPKNDDKIILPPFVQIRFNEEKYEQATQNYYENKIIPELVQAPSKPIIPVEPKREYPTKQGAMYPKSQIQLEQKHQDAWNQLLIQTVQEEQKQSGQKPQTDKEILASFDNLPNMKKKLAIRALKTQHPELAKRQEEEEKQAYEMQLQKNLARQRRKKAKKELKAQQKAQNQAPEKSSTLKQTLQQAQIQNPQKPQTKGLKNTLKQAQTKASVRKKAQEISNSHSEAKS